MEKEIESLGKIINQIKNLENYLVIIDKKIHNHEVKVKQSYIKKSKNQSYLNLKTE